MYVCNNYMCVYIACCKLFVNFRNVLDRFVTDNFPMKSTEFPVGSPKYNEYTGALDKVSVISFNYL